MMYRLTFMVIMLMGWGGLAMPAAARTAAPIIQTAAAYTYGQDPSVTVSGLPPRTVARVHMLRTLQIWQPDGRGGYAPVPTIMHGWGEYRADRRGRITLPTARPTAGSTLHHGPTSLLWSAYRSTDPAVAALTTARADLPATGGEVIHIRVEQAGVITASSRFTLQQAIPGATVIEIREPGFAGVFVAPPGARNLPTLIHLHGSEGGNISKARADAMSYAGRGFATLAVAYFAWEYEAEGLSIPNAHINIPVETLDRARAWLANRPESDPARIGLIGNSKGGELAVLGAATYPWVRAAVGCVPSDVVWEGYGRTAQPGEAISSWTLGGQPLPYIPTYNDRANGSPGDVWPNNGARYGQARAEFAAAADIARIPVDRIQGQLLLIGGDRDETWASGSMSRTIVARMRAAGRGRQVRAMISPTAGHYLCGDGLFPHRAYQVQSADPAAPVIDDEGAAAVSAFAAKIAFLRRWL